MIKNYISSYSLDYYEEGEVYSIYIRKGHQFAEGADGIISETYKAKLEKAEQEIDFSTEPASESWYLTRTIGVVTEKIPANKKKGTRDRVRFLIKLVDDYGEIYYGSKTYVANYEKGVETDGWEKHTRIVPVEDGKFYLGNKKKNESDYIVADKPGKASGITIDEGNIAGRVTVDNDSDPGSSTKNRKGDASGVTIDEKTTKPKSKKAAGVTVDDVTGVTLDED